MTAFAVAIDGPGGAGKSSAAKQISNNLGMTYIDTGALYRAVGLFMLRKGVDVYSEGAVSAALPAVAIRLSHGEAGQRLWLNGEDVTDALRTQEVAESASAVATYGAVRAFLLERQRELARTGRVIMDGRDIGTTVLPWAQLKIYLDASQDDRVARRISELTQQGVACDAAQVRRDIETRDERDMNRAVAPLKLADDAVYVDSTGMDLARVVETLTALIRDAERIP